MKNEKNDTLVGWSEAIASINFSEPYYVRKENIEEGKYKVISVAEGFHNPEEKVVTFYNLRDESGRIFYLKHQDFVEQFELKQS